MSKRTFNGTFNLVFLGAVAVATIPCAGATQESSDQPVAPAPLISAEYLLQELERADQNIQTFSAGIKYEVELSLTGDRQTRYGSLSFATRPDDLLPDGRPKRSFAVIFDKLVVDELIYSIDERWVFDGRWLIERNEEQKLFTKRELAPPGGNLDPLRLGEGPIPLPIGQKREEILARYIATIVPSDEEAPLSTRSFVTDTHQLRLVPKADAESEFKEVRLWYRKDDLLPRMARTVNGADDVTVVLLIEPKINDPSFDHSVVDVAAPPESAGWNVQIIEGRFE